MIVLGIESSCDETAAAVVAADGSVLADVVSSQIALHAPYGGVVPELAARAHIENIVPVIEQALANVPGGLEAIEGVAVTQGPGLVGALLVGVQAAKSIALARALPLVGVNHLIGHLLAVFLRRDTVGAVPEFPFIALLVSGGHTALYEVRSPSDIEQLGQTRDDAAGEAFDKAAKLLGLGYPGGPRVDRLAARGDASRIRLPRPLAGRRGLEFSFSGLKTAVAQYVVAQGGPGLDDQHVADLCASFQHNVISVLVEKSLAACAQRGVPRLVITGGVAANRGLRALAQRECAAAAVALFVPEFASCTDNAAMIAYAGAQRLIDGANDGLGLSVFSRSPVLGGSAPRYRSSRLPRS
jgi:N6-L-threonylcarbamoyladenine synthase